MEKVDRQLGRLRRLVRPLFGCSSKRSRLFGRFAHFGRQNRLYFQVVFPRLLSSYEPEYFRDVVGNLIQATRLGQRARNAIDGNGPPAGLIPLTSRRV